MCFLPSNLYNSGFFEVSARRNQIQAQKKLQKSELSVTFSQFKLNFKSDSISILYRHADCFNDVNSNNHAQVHINNYTHTLISFYTEMTVYVNVFLNAGKGTAQKGKCMETSGKM